MVSFAFLSLYVILLIVYCYYMWLKNVVWIKNIALRKPT